MTSPKSLVDLRFLLAQMQPVLTDVGARARIIRVAMVDLDDFLVARRTHGDHWAARQRDAVQGIVESLCRDESLARGCWHLEPDVWVILFSGSRRDLAQRVPLVTENLRRKIESDSKTTGTMSLSQEHGGRDRLARAVIEAMQTMQQKLVLGGNRVITASLTHSTLDRSPMIDRVDAELVRLIRDADREGVLRLLKARLEEWTHQKGATPEMVRSWLAAEILLSMSVAAERRLADGSIAWSEAFRRVPFEDLAALSWIYERGYLELWLDQLLYRILPEPGSYRASARQITALATAYIDRHYPSEISLNQVARAIFVSPYYISHLFRRELDTTFLKYLTATRIQHARELLVTSEEPLAKIAALSGFPSAMRFRAVFKRSTGMTPTQYRRAHLDH